MPTERWDLAADLTEICTHGHRRLLITGLLLKLLTNHFSRAEQLIFPELSGRLWTATEDSPLIIESSWSWKPLAASKRPALLVRAGPLQAQRIALADLQETLPSGKNSFAKMLSGSHTILVIAATEAESETLAAETFRFLLRCEQPLQRSLNLLRFQIAELGPPTLMEEYAQMIGCQISLQYAWLEAWEIAPQGTEELKGLMLITETS